MRPRLRLRRRRPGQAIVEFGIVALLLVLIMFAIVDFGMLLNGWLGISSAARDGARKAAVGRHIGPTFQDVLQDERILGASANDVQLKALYCRPVVPPTTPPTCQQTAIYCLRTVPNTGCNVWATDPNDPQFQDFPQAPQPPAPPPSWPAAGDTVTFTVSAPLPVVTPLVRPFFGCDGFAPTCNATLSASTTMRYEGYGVSPR
jgi:Flp pilus assembly protein TadG